MALKDTPPRKTTEAEKFGWDPGDFVKPPKSRALRTLRRLIKPSDRQEDPPTS